MSEPKKHYTMLEALQKASQGARLRVVDDVRVTMDAHETVRLDDYCGPGGWQNQVSGFGTPRDKTTYNEFYGPYIMGLEQLSALYHGDDLAARMVDIVPDEMLREGFSVDTDDADLNAGIADRIEGLGLLDKLADAIRWGRLYGGGALLLGCDDGKSATTPLQADRSRSLSYVYTFDRRYLFPLTWYRDAGNPKLGQTETYMVTSPTFYADSPVSIVHESRLILFGGANTGIRERQANFGWDLSVLQRANKILGDFNIGWNAVAVLLQDGNQAVFKMNGLTDAIASGLGPALQERFRSIDAARSVVNAMVIDAGNGTDNPPESFERQSFPMAGIPETLDRLCLRIAAALQIPVTILMGQSPAGMNATGQSDFQWFYDKIRAQQTLKLAPKIRRLIKVMLAAKDFAKDPKNIKIDFPPLWSEAPGVRATTRKTLLEGDAIAIQNSMVLPAEAALSRFAPEGFETELKLSDEGVKARESELKLDLVALADGEKDQAPAPKVVAPVHEGEPAQVPDRPAAPPAA